MLSGSQRKRSVARKWFKFKQAEKNNDGSAANEIYEIEFSVSFSLKLLHSP